MKIIDFERKGNQVKFYLGDDNENNYWGDDWDDAPYEHNAGQVYDEFVKDTKMINFDFDDLVLEPSDGSLNSKWSKDDMSNRRTPCIIVVPAQLKKHNWSGEFNYWNQIQSNKITKFYFGDKVD